MMLLYSANGMSETSLMCCILWSALQTVRWVDNRKLAHLLGMATGIALATWVRYEALPLIAAVIASILVTAIIDKRESWTAVRVQGTILAVVVPAFYSVGLWILFNGLIMGDPFYFLRSEYSNSAQTATFRTNPNDQQLGYHDVVHAIAYSVRHLTLVSLWYLPFAILVLIASIQTGRASTISLFVISAAVPTFHIALLYMGSSYGWLRFFIYAWPFSVIFAAILYTDYERWTQRFRAARGNWHRLIRRTSHMLPLFMVMLLVVGDVIAGVAMARPDVGREEHAFVDKMLRPSTILENNRSFAAEADVTRYLDNNLEGLVLIDSSTGFPITLASMHPEQFVINSDIEFQRAVVAPYLYVQRLLVPAPVGIFKSDTLNLHYPDLYEGRLPWAVLEKEFGTHNEWRLYRVIALSPR